MKNFNLENFGVQEMSLGELVMTNGGGFWLILAGIGTAILCVGLAIGSVAVTGGGAVVAIAGLLGSIDDWTN